MKKLWNILSLKPASGTSGKSGFTLVEILLVVAILGILAGVAVLGVKGRTDTANQAATRTSIAAIQTAIDAYEVDNGAYPQSLQNLITKGSEENWNGPYIRGGKIPRDAWGNEFVYSVSGDGNYVIKSVGTGNRAGKEITN